MEIHNSPLKFLSYEFAAQGLQCLLELLPEGLRIALAGGVWLCL